MVMIGIIDGRGQIELSDLHVFQAVRGTLGLRDQ